MATTVGSVDPQTLQCSPLVRAVLLAQLLSVLLAVTGISAQTLANAGFSAPTFQSFQVYLLLALTCGPLHLWAVFKPRGTALGIAIRSISRLLWRGADPNEEQRPLHAVAASPRQVLCNPWWAYMLLAILDVEGNFLVTKAYQYTSLTSVTLLDCFTIPTVMLLSFIVFGLRYKVGHLGGAVLCVGGLMVLMLTDGNSATGGPNPVLGDCLVLAGACVYALCNVMQEQLLTTGTTTIELLASLGLCGSLVSGIQAAMLERPAIAAMFSDQATSGFPLPASATALMGFVTALYCFYITVPAVLRDGGSTVLNLSLLTSDLWAAAARIVMFGGFGGTGWYFVVAVFCETAGMVLYVHSGEAVRAEQGSDAGFQRFRLYSLLTRLHKTSLKGSSASIRYDRLEMADEAQAKVAALSACCEMREADKGHCIARDSWEATKGCWGSTGRIEQVNPPGSGSISGLWIVQGCRNGGCGREVHKGYIGSDTAGGVDDGRPGSESQSLQASAAAAQPTDRT